MNSNANESKRFAARLKTLAALRQLNPSRRTFLMYSLFEANLITTVETRRPIISLASADLTGVDISRKEGVKWVRPIQCPALEWTIMNNASFRSMGFEGPSFVYAELQFADFSGSVITVHSTNCANSMANMKTKHFEISVAKSKLDISTHFNTAYYNLCRNQSLSNNRNKTMINCLFNTQFILKKSEVKLKSSVTRKSDKEIEATIKIPRCGVRDDPLMYSVEAQWKKKSLTWKLLDGDHPSYGTVTQYEEADFELAFIHRVHDPIRRFDGPGGILAYAFLPPSGMIRFEAEEPWTDDTTGYNLRVIATHEIGHALGLVHSNDPSSIMFKRYQLFQPHDLLPRDVSNDMHFSSIVRLPTSTVFLIQ
ncbi:unnamed protein product [Adineta steineri]|uniref:Peptidase metallopeptidase domain-containing protein n=1 Tax=Adineta steineri TaxID=433720 RepID=A0A819GJ87_9BILA|nr:unnamed protein product [Adineta steineri]CAF3882660.1 unnamed protein product [Adineta steineri]